MILSEYPYKGNKRLIRTYSDDAGKALLQAETGRVYDEAIDVYPCKFTYKEIEKTEETTVPIEREVDEIGLQQPDLPG